MSEGLGVAFVLLTIALPPLTKMFTTLNVPLPLPTRILMGLSAFMAANKLYILAALAVFIPGLIWYSKQPRGKRVMDRFKMRIPVLGLAVRTSELAKMAQTMAMLLNSGLSLQDIMDIVPKTTTNSIMRDAMESVRQGLILGQGLSNPMSAQPIFPILFLQMVRVGEETNNLESNLRVLATFYQASATERTEAVVAMIAPLSTIVLAGMAGFIALSVIMPMYNITSAF